mmetsp:Transcript_42217/g.88659  ORF Transcript_42217/g.88659 Transcript_42217/m.88659 type:complete len:278 (+) Transcript_42217:265-1098(+)
MHIIFCTIYSHGHVIVDNNPHILHVQTTRRDISRNQHAKRPLLEGIDNLGSFPLGSVPMKRINGETLIPKRVCQLVSNIFLRYKYNHFGMFLPAKVYGLPLKLAPRRLRFRRLFLCLLRGFDELCQYFFQLISFIVILAHDDVLRNILVGVELIRVADIDLHGVRQKVERQPLDLLGPRGRKEQSLPLRGVRYIAHDGSDLRLEAHVKHSVCFIQYNEFDSREISFSHFDEVVDSTGGGDDAFYSAFESCDLRVLGGSPVTTDAANAVGSSELLCLV